MSYAARSQKITVTCRTCGITESFYSTISVKHFKLNHQGHDVVDGSEPTATQVRGLRQQAVTDKTSQAEPGVKLARVIVELVNFPALPKPVFRIRGIKEDGEEAFVQVMVYEEGARVRGMLARGQHLDQGFSELLYIWEPEALEYSPEVREVLGLGREIVPPIAKPQEPTTPPSPAADESVRATNESMFESKPTEPEAKDAVFPSFLAAPEISDPVLRPKEAEWPLFAPRASPQPEPETRIEPNPEPAPNPFEETPPPARESVTEPLEVNTPEPMHEPEKAPPIEAKIPEPTPEPARDVVLEPVIPEPEKPPERMSPPVQPQHQESIEVPREPPPPPRPDTSIPRRAAPAPATVVRAPEQIQPPRPEPRAPRIALTPPPPVPRPVRRVELEHEPGPKPVRPKPKKQAAAAKHEVAAAKESDREYLLVSKSWFIDERPENRKEAVRISKVLSAFRWKVEPIYTIGVMIDDIMSIETTRNEFSGALIRRIEKTGYALSAVTTDTGKPIAWFKKLGEEDKAFQPGVSG